MTSKEHQSIVLVSRDVLMLKKLIQYYIQVESDDQREAVVDYMNHHFESAMSELVPIIRKHVEKHSAK